MTDAAKPVPNPEADLTSPKQADDRPDPNPPADRTPPKSPDSRSQQDQVDDRLRVLKEVVTSVLALGIVGATLFWASMSFGFTGDPIRMQDSKDLLAGLTGLTGVVLGYYFGRGPSEAHAFRAQRQVDEAVTERSQMESKVDHIYAKVQEMADNNEPMTREGEMAIRAIQ
jgi:hypothetical protein